ncbi:hypothetical protein OG884_26465 [Streptosporangium sp. NBC_01755]|uniref:phage distal tail protein n=1 Tax=Streptosporangium sp. NBC_01755 TaxID=2975949 RepID=UPI002DDBF4E6|nr:hypothetical protein [Streptosporangium sp. NBC_01755]WSC98393.1 hypothetical protein OG884_26465 [Streptosporangium sp. NBC_01755]
MAVALRSVSTGTLNATGSGNITKPSGAVAGDLLIAFHSVDEGTLANMGTPSGGATWTSLATRNSGTAHDMKTKVWWKIAGGSEPADYGFTQNSAGQGCVVIAAISGAAATTPVVAQSGNDAFATTTSTPGITPTGANDLELRWAAGNPDFDTVAWSPPATYTEQADIQSGGNTAATLATKVLTSSATTSSLNFTSSPEVGFRHGFTVAVATGAVDAEATLTTVAVITTTPDPSVSAGAGVSLSTVAATTSVPTPGVSAGSSTAPNTVTVAASVPTPNVTTDQAEIVTPGTVTVTTTVPDPTVSAGHSLQPAAVELSVDIYPMSVDAQFNAEIDLPAVALQVEIPGALVSVPIRPGDNISRPGQLEFNGTLFGSGTPYRWRSLVGWRDRANLDSGNVPRASRHGSWAGRPLLQERIITWAALLKAPPQEVEAAIDALEQALPVLEDETELPLVINDLGIPYLAFGRIDRVQLPVDAKLRLGLGQLTLQWVCSDPRRYAVNATGVTIPVGEARDVSNAGNAATHPLLRVNGPAPGPIVLNETLDRVVEFNLTVPTGKQLLIDCDLGTATIDGVDVMGKLTGSSVHPSDFVLGRGLNIVSHDATSGGVDVDVLYRDAWA